MNKYSFLVTPTPKEQPSNMSKPPVPTNRTMKKEAPKANDKPVFSTWLCDNNIRASVHPNTVNEAFRGRVASAENWQAHSGVMDTHGLLCRVFGGQG
jgi:hypothetical protein